MLRSVTVLLLLVLVVTPAYADGISTTDQFSSTLENLLYTVAWVTDTQHYSEEYPEVWQQTVEYINEEAAQGRIHYVVHTGDLVQHDYDETEWVNFGTAWDSITIDKDLLAGNHDVSGQGDYSEYEKRYPDQVYHSSEKQGWQFVFLSWEIIQNETVKEWLRDTINSSDLKTIVLTHGYVTAEVGRGHDSSAILEVLTTFDNRTFSVWCGHEHADRIVHRTDGNTLAILHNFQSYTNGGNGYFVLVDMYENGYYMRLVSPIEGYDGLDKGRYRELSIVLGANGTSDNTESGFTISDSIYLILALGSVLIFIIILKKRMRS